MARAGVEEAKPKITAQFDAFAALLAGRFFMGAESGAVDFPVYPLAALVKRLETPRPDEGLATLVPDPIYVWAREIESMSGFASTYPTHWRS